MASSEEKTEQPTFQRLREARKKGQVAKSSDIAALSTIFAGSIFIVYFSFNGAKKICELLITTLSADFFRLEGSFISNALIKNLNMWLLLAAPLLICIMFFGILGNVVQFGLLLSTHPLKPDITKIDPIRGLKKLFSLSRMVECLKQTVKFSLIFLVIIHSILSFIPDIIKVVGSNLDGAIWLSLTIISHIMSRVLVCFFVIAICDLLWSRYNFLRQMRMSKAEVKREYKQHEGDPELKQERRKIAMESFEQIEPKNLENAAVLLINPVHLAVAIEYDETSCPIPKVIAKGIGDHAKKLRELAKRADVPIIRNVALTRDLQWLSIEEEIPDHLFDPVAEVLTYIAELEQLKVSKL